MSETPDPWDSLRVVLTFEGDWVFTSPPLDVIFAGIFLNMLRDGTPNVVRSKIVPAENVWPEPAVSSMAPSSDQPYSPWDSLRVILSFEGEWPFTSPPLDTAYAVILLNALRDGTPRVIRAKLVPAEYEWPQP